MNTCIIISNLSKDDFVANRYTNDALSLVDKIKLDILNVDIDEDEDYYLNRITNWSNLPFLNRVVIILKDEATSEKLHRYIQEVVKTRYQLKDSVKINLQSNLLHKSKSFDNLVDDSLSINDLKKFKLVNSANIPPEIKNYEEPKPQKQPATETSEEDNSINSTFMSPTLLPAGSQSPNFKRSRSLTRTLYKPPLSIDTNVESEASIPSPTITLDESN